MAVFLLALSVALPMAARYRDPASVPRWTDSAEFVGVAFTVNDHPCRAGVFLPGGLEGMVCIGDPWGDEE